MPGEYLKDVDEFERPAVNDGSDTLDLINKMRLNNAIRIFSSYNLEMVQTSD